MGEPIIESIMPLALSQMFSIESAVLPSTWLILGTETGESEAILQYLLYTFRHVFQTNTEFGVTGYTCGRFVIGANDPSNWRNVQNEVCCDHSTSLICAHNLQLTTIRESLSPMLEFRAANKVSAFLCLPNLDNWRTWYKYVDYLIWCPSQHSTFNNRWIQEVMRPTVSVEDSTCLIRSCSDIDFLVFINNSGVQRFEYNAVPDFVLHEECPDRAACELVNGQKPRTVYAQELSNKLSHVLVEIVLNYLHPKVHACCHQ
jgi:hypothetical protein